MSDAGSETVPERLIVVSPVMRRQGMFFAPTGLQNTRSMTCRRRDLLRYRQFEPVFEAHPDTIRSFQAHGAAAECAAPCAVPRIP